MTTSAQRVWNGAATKWMVAVFATITVAGVTWTLSWGYHNERALAIHNVNEDAHPARGERLKNIEADVKDIDKTVTELDRKVDRQTVLLEQIKETVKNGH